MRGVRTIRRVAWVGLALSAGCGRRHKQPVRERPARSAAQASALADAGTKAEVPPLPPPIAQALADVHRQKLEIFAPREEPARLAFGRAHLAQAMGDKIAFRDTRTGLVLTDASLGAVLAVASGVDGALFALGVAGGARLEAGSSKLERFAHVAFLPGSALFPDLTDPEYFFVYYAAEAQLFQYAFRGPPSAFLPIADRFPLSGCVSAPALLRDGAFVCSTSNGIERRAPRGRETRYPLPAGVPVAVRWLPAPRLDELFLVSQAGEVVHLRLQTEPLTLARFQLPALPFAAAANADSLAFLLVSPLSVGSSRRWILLVTDFGGAPRFQTDLASPEAPADDDWLKAVLGDKNLALSPFEPLVAVGGADSLRVWDYQQRVPRFGG